MRWPRSREIWIASVVLTAILVWAGRFFVNPDGISYLDLSDAFRSGDWSQAANRHWSPAYPFLLSVWLRWISPGSPQESLLVHAMNGGLFLAALAAFQFFLAELRASRAVSSPALDLDTPEGWFSAHMIFFWCALVLITIRGVTPDMLVAAIGFVIAGLVTRIRSGRGTTASFVVLGAVLGVAALSKSFMFSVAILLLMLLAIANRRMSASRKNHAVAALVFLAIVSPQLIALSRQAGRPNFGDSAKLVYLLKVNKQSKFDGPRIARLAENPRTVAFPSNRANQTYPLWDDPAAWHEGTRVQVHASGQLQAIGRNVVIDAGIALKVVLPLLIVLLLRDRRAKVQHRLLSVVAIAVLVAYAMLHSEARLIGFWIALLTVSVLAGTSLDTRWQRQGKIVVRVIAVICVISWVTYVFHQVSRKSDRSQYAVANRINALGLERGTRVALIGDESDIYWARLAGVQVAAQIPLPDAPRYWVLDDTAKAEINRRLAGTGARALVASWTSPPQTESAWIKVQGTQYAILPFTEPK